MAADTWLRNRVNKLMGRVAVLETDPDLSDRIAALEAWRAALEGEGEPEVALPAGYTRLQDFGIDMAGALNWSDPAVNIFLPTWEQGPLSVGNPALLSWNADGSVTIDAITRAHAATGRTWQTGALQFNRPKLAAGRAGAIIHATDPSAVCAFFGHDSKTSKEIDFELTWKDGVAGWAPAVHMPRAAGGVNHSSKRVMARAPWADRPQVLEYDLRADRVDFYCDGVLFETITPADMDDPSAWDTTTGMSQHCAIEKHTGWAGWDYASGKAQMIVHAMKVEPAAPHPPLTGTRSLALGLEGATDWDTSTPFNDELKSARDWTGHSGRQWGDIPRAAIEAAKDADGQLTRMPDGAAHVELLLFVDYPAAMEPTIGGRYRLRWTGAGDLRVAGQPAGDSGEFWFDFHPRGGMLAIALHGIDSSDPIRLLDVVREDRIAAYEAGEIFKPQYLERLGEAGLLRFMDWGRVNVLVENRNRTLDWSKRPLPGDLTYTGPHGVPIEIMCALCNRLDADGWFNVPHNVTDDFIRGYAEVVKANLRPHLQATVAYSNEVWNGIFGQCIWAEERGQERWPGTDKVVSGQQFYAGEVVRMGRIWDDVFSDAPNRIRIMLETHPANSWMTDQQLTADRWCAWDEANGGAGDPPAEYVDAIATTGYFGHSLAGGAAAQQLADIDRAEGETAAIEWGIDYLDIDAEHLPYAWAEHKALADRHGLALSVYEGGPHANLTGQWHNSARQLHLMTAIHRDPRMAAIYTKVLDYSVAAGIRDFAWFVAIGRWTKDGFWGLLEHIDAQSPGWDALLAWARANPRQV